MTSKPQLPSSGLAAPATTRILAIETSCDETAAAVIDDGRWIRSNVIASQIDLHQQYGGVFPEMASRAHIEAITPVITQAMQQANAGWQSISAVAVTKGPGLPGSLVVGVNAAKGICLARGLPLIGVNHLEGHVYSHWLEAKNTDNRQQISEMLSSDSPFPLMILIVSGGHTELVLMREHGKYDVIGLTVDDAAGEAFDKVARALQLGYPGGPAIQKAALAGNPQKFKLSKPRIGATGLRGILRPYDGAFDFSFSGTKTAVLALINQFNAGQNAKENEVSARVPVNDIAASFQDAVTDWLVERTVRAAEMFKAKAILVGGGVSANALLRQKMKTATTLPTSFPPLALCTDNAAMIGAAAHFAFVRGVRDPLGMDVVPDLQIGI